jgi:uncharacterized protein
MYTSQILASPLGAFTAADPTQPAGPRHACWEWGDSQVEVGIWECTPGRMNGLTGDFDEMMCMVAGRVTVDHDEGSYDIAPGTAWVTPRQWPCTWTIHQTVRKLYVIDHRAGGVGQPVHLGNAHTATLGAPTPRAGATTGDPHESALSIWNHNGLDVGVWESTPGVFPASRIGYDEVFVCLSGAATMTTSDGERFDLTPGSVLLTPNGFTGTWDVSETFRKVYCIIRRT